jgi:hypothetical protein
MAASGEEETSLDIVPADFAAAASTRSLAADDQPRRSSNEARQQIASVTVGS